MTVEPLEKDSARARSVKSKFCPIKLHKDEHLGRCYRNAGEKSRPNFDHEDLFVFSMASTYVALLQLYPYL